MRDHEREHERLSGAVLLLRALARAVRQAPSLDDPVLLIMLEEAERMGDIAAKYWGLADLWAEHPPRRRPRFTDNVVPFKRRDA